ncbi:MAG: isoprenylcysteine carboxylmethyltransferase family protein [Ruminococcus sp.]|nr:isoprenylcysteine carboxylmethyltransferase family protein [Ruminococcus sp.]
MNFSENNLPFKLMAIFILAVFYAIYFGKMIIQKKKGITTHQIGKRKEKKLHTVETLMSVATFSVVIIQLLSIFFDWNIMPSGARFTGFCIAGIGDIFFLISVTYMKDSWRAGIPEKDKTKLVTDGIYKFSRNPAFVGFDFMYIGILLMFFNIGTLLFSLFSIMMLHLQILQEEKYMAKTFGEEYLEYKKKVFRYIGRR